MVSDKEIEFGIVKALTRMTTPIIIKANKFKTIFYYKNESKRHTDKDSSLVEVNWLTKYSQKKRHFSKELQ